MLKIVSILFFSFLFFSQNVASLSPEWIFSDKNTLFTTANIIWTLDNQAIIYDLRIPQEIRTLELYNPLTKNRSSLIDRAKALKSFWEASGEEWKNLPPASSYSRQGDKALYQFKGDSYVLYFRESRFQRITASKSVEKAVKFSPDGKSISFVRENDLYIYNLTNKKEKRITKTGSETRLNGTLSWVYWEEIFGRRDIAYWWSDDSKSIAFFETDESEVDLIHYVDFKPDVQRLIKQRYPKAGNVNPKVRVGIHRLSSNTITWYDKKSFAYEYIVRVKWLPDNKRLSIQTLNRKQDQLDLYFVNTNKKKSVHILKEVDPAWVNIHDDLHFLRDRKHFIWKSEHTGFAHLYLHKMSGEKVSAITKGNWATVSSSRGLQGHRQTIAVIDEANQQLYFTAMKKSSIERQLYRVNFDGKNLLAITKEAGRHSVSFSPNSKYYINNYSRIDRAPEKSFFYANGEILEKISVSNMNLAKELDLQYPELFTIKTKDGFDLPAQLLKPANFDPKKKYGLILKVYGGPSAPSVSNSFQYENLYNNLLLKEGFLHLSVDNRAATAISKTLENRFAKNSMAVGELPDIIEAVKFMKAKPFIDANRVGLWGWSGGGTFTLTAMTNSTEFAAGISGAPNTDGRYYDTKWMEMYVKDPERYERSSLVKAAKNLSGKIMFIHGTYDDNVHIQHTYAVVDELIKAGKLYEMMIYPMRKHGFSDRPALIHRYKTMIDFWRRNMSDK